jgi:copper chaperone CopZ
MMQYQYHEEVLKALRNAGWYEGRQVSTMEWETVLSLYGVPCFEAARQALREFGGLHIQHPWHCPYIKNSKVDINLDPIQAGVNEEDRIVEWQKILGFRFYPIGDYGHHMLLISDVGRVYMNGYDFGHRIGDTIQEALHQLIVYNRTLERVLYIKTSERIVDDQWS